MKQLLFLIGCVCLVAMVLPACAPQPEQQTEPVAEEATSTEADLEAIESTIVEWEEAIVANDIDRVMSVFADSIIVMPPNEAEVVGKPAVRAFHQDFFDQFTADEADFTSKEVEVCGNWSFYRATFSEKWTPKTGGEQVQEVGKYIAVLEKQTDGSWKYTHLIWNSDNPLPAEPTT